MSEPIRLNLGAGSHPLDGYINVDRKFPPDAKGGELRAGEVHPLNFPDNFADECRCSHVLEHFSHRQTLAVLREWVRVLKPGGVLKVAVPDVDKWVDYYTNGSGDLPLEGFMFGGHVDDDDKHGAMFNRQKLTQLMHLAGLGEVRPWKSEIQDCASLPISLNLMGVKGAGAYPRLSGKVAACLSMPRLAFTDNMVCCLRAMTALQIPTIRRAGAFWGQCLQTSMEQQAATGVPYVLTIDYDTLFTPDDVVALYRLMEEHPEADAICPIQSGRDRATPLMTVQGLDGVPRQMLTSDELAGDLLELRSGHFGLTMIRTASLAKLPKPWFLHKPDENGGWSLGRIDDDVWFWLKLREHGMRLFQANRVTVGHAQLVATWPGRNLESIHQYMTDYDQQGKPEDAWK